MPTNYNLFTTWELRFLGHRFQSLFKGHDFMVCQGDWVPDTSDKPQNFRPNCPSCDALHNDYMEDLYDAEMLRRAENEPFPENEFDQEMLELHTKFQAHDNPSYVGDMPMESIVIERAQTIGWELYGWWNFQINLWRWFIANETDIEAKSIVSKLIHRFSLSNVISIEEEELHQTLREWKAEDDGPVEGVDSHAYYGPMTTLTNFIEAQRDREFD